MNDDDNTSNEEETTPWWNRESVSEAQAGFRRALQGRRPDIAEVWHAWMLYFLVSNVNGLTRRAALCLAGLVQRADRERCQVEKALPHHALGGLTRMTFRALLAMAEQPDVPAATVRRVAALVDALFMEDGCIPADHAAARLAWTARLALPPDPADAAVLADGWNVYTARKDESRRNKEETGGDDDDRNREVRAHFKAVCPAAAAQILTESLLRLGHEVEAFAIAAEALEENPCIGPCGLAPQGMLSAVLLPLHRAGRQELAAGYAARLARVAPLSHAWLEPAAARITYLIHSGKHAEALGLCRTASEFASNPETSGWHRLRFHRAASDCLKTAGGTESAADAAAHDRAASLLEQAFASRNAQDVPLQSAGARLA